MINLNDNIINWPISYYLLIEDFCNPSMFLEFLSLGTFNYFFKAFSLLFSFYFHEHILELNNKDNRPVFSCVALFKV